MTYKEADLLLQGRCKKSRRVDHFTYLVRYNNYIALRIGWRPRYRRTFMTFFKDGRISISCRMHFPSYRNRINNHLPGDYRIRRYHGGHWFIRDGDNDVNKSLAKRLVINPDGTLRNWRGKTKEEILRAINLKRKEQKRVWEAANRPRRRGLYWINKARGIHRDKCNMDKVNCNWLNSWPRPTTQAERVLPCGCKITYKQPKITDSTSDILAEANATVRTVKIKMYGIEKFFKDAGAKIRDRFKNYQLMELDIGPDRPGWNGIRNRQIKALRMKCPSTGQTYVHTVPDDIGSVHRALNWIYSVGDYFGTVGKQA